MHSTITNRVGRSLRNVFDLVLAVALVGGVCISALAQLKTQKDASFVRLNTSVPVANMTSPSKSPSNSYEGKPAIGLSSLPPDAQGPISAALGKDDSGYWVRRNAEGFGGVNPRHTLVAEFTKHGIEVRSHNLHWGMETRGYGYGDALHAIGAVAPWAESNRVEYRRDGVMEWYENGPLGLEQGFMLAHPPGKAKGQTLTVELALRGDLVAALDPGGKGLELRGKDGKAVLRYTGVAARDATGRELRSWLEVRGERLLLRADDEGARYPVVVDPWVQQAELIASDGKANDIFGLSVAVSGSTAVVGAPGGDKFQGAGAAYVFGQSGGTWSQQAELTASDGKANDQFGYSVAVDGSTAVVGAYQHTVGSNWNQGAAYVFVQSGGTWSQQAELTASDGKANDIFGLSVAVSGSTAVVGGPQHAGGSNEAQGAAYVFVESGGTWNQQAELTASDGAQSDAFGYSVAVDGSTAVVGAPNKTAGSNGGQGVAYAFVQSGGTWSQQAELTASDGAAGDYFGGSVAVSGNTAVMGAVLHTVGSNVRQGAAYVFVESGGTWSQRAELTASDGTASDYFGNSVAVSGSTAVVGAPGGDKFQGAGAAYVFGQSGGTWSQQAELTASDGKAYDQFGSAVAVSGSTAVAGAPDHTVGSNQYQGAGYVFVPAPAVTLSPTSLSFGKQALNTSSAPKTVTLKNTGNATLDISAITISGDFAIYATTCGATLAAGKTCKLKVTFTPTQLGARTGTLTFTDNAPNSPQTVPLSGTGVPQATLTPARATYAKQLVGTTSPAKTFTLTNNQLMTLTSIVISTTGDFAVSSTTCGSSLAAKSNCTINVTFTPTQTGTRTGQLSVGDSASNSPQTSSLTGSGT
jgi:nucleoside-specific outer membrane channel protein Tsx